jgi:ABC-type microcin C transport system permease subunit YejB
MRDYIFRRVLLAIPAAIVVSLLSFLLVHLVPGDVVMAMLAEAPNFSPAEVADLRHQLGLDKPLPEQYADWLVGEERQIAAPQVGQPQPYPLFGAGPLVCPEQYQDPRAGQATLSCFDPGV